jgi:hypothetical protein
LSTGKQDSGIAGVEAEQAPGLVEGGNGLSFMKEDTLHLASRMNIAVTEGTGIAHRSCTTPKTPATMMPPMLPGGIANPLRTSTRIPGGVQKMTRQIS